jgi:hypothetical protein
MKVIAGLVAWACTALGLPAWDAPPGSPTSTVG